MQKFLRFEFIPLNTELGLLVLRVALGASIFWLHGWGKLMKLVNGSTEFSDPLGIGQLPSLVLAIFGEVVCSALVVLGWFTRLAALSLAITMAVAFFVVHQHKLSGPGSGELAFVYLVAFFVLFMAGAGKYSVDKR